MKKALTLSLFIAFLTLSLSAQDTNSIVGIWKNQETVSTTNTSKLLAGAQFSFKSDGSFTSIRRSGNESEGRWSLIDNNKVILLEYKAKESNRDLPQLSKKGSHGDKSKMNIVELSGTKLIIEYRKNTYTLVKSGTLSTTNTQETEKKN